MTQEKRDGRPASSVHHEPIVSETLKEGAERHRQEAEAAAPAEAERLVREEESLKRHGDALQTGTGNRHGAEPREADQE